MKKLGAIFAVLGVFLMIAVGCNSSADDTSTSSDLPSGTVADVKVGMTEQEVLDLVGEPRTKIGSDTSGDAMSDPDFAKQIRWVYTADRNEDMFMIRFVDGNVTKIETGPP